MLCPLAAAEPAVHIRRKRPITEEARLDPDFIRDLFAPFGPVAVRRMFGGAGIFADGLMIGLVVRDTIYLKADEASIADFEREGSKPFSYVRGKGARGKTQAVLSYWQLPERLYDDPEALSVWAERAFAVATKKKAPKARRTAAAKPRRRRAPSRQTR